MNVTNSKRKSSPNGERQPLLGEMSVESFDVVCWAEEERYTVIVDETDANSIFRG
jgi:hypothetical protein